MGEDVIAGSRETRRDSREFHGYLRPRSSHIRGKVSYNHPEMTFEVGVRTRVQMESNTYPVHYVVYLKILDFDDANSDVDVTWKLINMEDDTPPLNTEITLSVIDTCDTDVYTQKYISLYNSVHDLCIDFDTKRHKGSGVVTMIPYDAVCMDVCCYRRNKTAGWLKKENHTYTFDHAKVCPSLAEPLIVSVKQI